MPGVTKDDVKSLFSCIGIISSYHSSQLPQLRTTIVHFTGFTQLGKSFFNDLSGFLKIYAMYINNYNQSIQTLKRLNVKSPAFAKFVLELEDSGRWGSTLDSLLIGPIQRLPRYVLLLSELLKNSVEEYRDYAYLKKALVNIKEIADTLNERKRDAEDRQAIVDIFNIVLPKQIDLIQPARKLCKSGNVSMMVPAKKPKQKNDDFIATKIFLFNDLVLICTKRPNSEFMDLKERISIDTIKVNTNKKSEYENTFELLLSKGRSIILATRTNEEKEEWERAINLETLRLDRARLDLTGRIIRGERKRSNSGRRLSPHAPIRKVSLK